MHIAPDAISRCADFFIDGKADNPRFGIDNWQHGWDGEQEDYTFGENLDKEDKGKVENMKDVTVTADQGRPIDVSRMAPCAWSKTSNLPSLCLVLWKSR